MDKKDTQDWYGRYMWIRNPASNAQEPREGYADILQCVCLAVDTDTCTMKLFLTTGSRELLEALNIYKTSIIKVKIYTDFYSTWAFQENEFGM